MTKEEIYSRLTQVFREVLEDDTLELLPETTADDVDAWDSLSHVQLIVAAEQDFGVRFTSREIMKWRNVGEWVECIEAKTSN